MLLSYTFIISERGEDTIYCYLISEREEDTICCYLTHLL